MVSACVLYLDRVELAIQKRFVPDEMSALFQESDRFETPDPDGDDPRVEYRAPRNSILKRLDVMGCTKELAHRRFEEWRAEQIEYEEEYLKGWKNDQPDGDKTLKALKDLTWKEWCHRIPGVLATLFEFDTYVDETDRQMKTMDEKSWLFFDGYGSLLTLRAIIEAATNTQDVALCVGDLIGGGWIKPDTKVCAEKVRIVAARGQPSGPAIILAEGKSDIAILKASIERFHPDLTDFVTFLDHSEFRVDGGASYVVKFLKAFAASRVPANIVAVFDNDAAGLAAYRKALALKLPDNMTCIHLPDIELARSYPTIGPQGNHDADVNGRACGIELYLGRSALSSNGNLRPVRWTGYDQHADTYQGEVAEKKRVQDAFLSQMRDSTSRIDSGYPEMQLVWQAILNAIIQTAKRAQLQGRSPPDW